MRALSLAAGLAVLALAWAGPPRALAERLFTGHMALHVTIVALAAPLIAVFLAPRLAASRWAPVVAMPALATVLEFVVMWGWHLPELHAAARFTTWGFMAEQASFLLAGLWIWCAALAPGQALAGAGGLLLTSMHVTLLGAILTLSPRPLYPECGGAGLSPLADQALGGTLMLAVATPVYLAGRPRPDGPRPARRGRRGGVRWRDLLPRPRRPDRDRLVTFEHDTVIWGALALVAAGATIAFGLYDVAARSGHWSVVRWALHQTYERSVALRAALDDADPTAVDLDDIALIQRGAGHFHGGCLACHAAPGRRQDLVALSMVPQPPHVTDAIEGWSADELHWIVWNGVKMSGMPQWPSEARPDEVWSVVAFLRAVPGMSAEEYDALVFGETRADPGAGGAEIGALHDGPLDPAIRTCVRCHGADGRGRGTGAFPRLDIQTPEYILASLRAYAAGTRHSGIMRPVAFALTDDEMRRAALHYGTVPALAEPSPRTPDAPELIERGRALAHAGGPVGRKGADPSCAACHGPWPEPRDRRYPNLAGQHMGYLIEQLHAWKDDERGGTSLARLMHPVAHALEEADMRALAVYYASLPGMDHEEVEAAEAAD